MQSGEAAFSAGQVVEDHRGKERAAPITESLFENPRGEIRVRALIRAITGDVLEES